MSVLIACKVIRLLYFRENNIEWMILNWLKGKEVDFIIENTMKPGQNIIYCAETNLMFNAVCG